MKISLSKMFILSLIIPSLSLAHTGATQTTGFMHGFGHPIGGVDHILAMIAVGIWAAQIGGKALFVVPSTFVAFMILGGLVGFSGFPGLFIETGISVSILIFGIFVAGAFKLPLAYSSLIVGVFALFHGYAHGAEMPISISAASYAFGFAISTAFLHLSGIGLGLLTQRTNLHKINRYAGGVIALGGVYLAIA